MNEYHEKIKEQNIIRIKDNYRNYDHLAKLWDGAYELGRGEKAFWQRYDFGWHILAYAIGMMIGAWLW